MAKKPAEHLNAEGTHVHLSHPDIPGSSWWCPLDAAPVFVEHRGWEHTPPRDTSLDGLFDASTAEGPAQTGFDPAEHDVPTVNAYLAEHAHAAPGEVARVLELERAGQNRKTIVDPLAEVEVDTTVPTTGD